MSLFIVGLIGVIILTSILPLIVYGTNTGIVIGIVFCAIIMVIGLTTTIIVFAFPEKYQNFLQKAKQTK